MPQTADISGSLHRFCILPLAGWPALALLGVGPTRALAGQDGVAAMLVGQAVVGLVVMATLIPSMRRMRHATAHERFRIALRAGVIRLVAVVPIAGLIAWAQVVEPSVFLVWLSIAYGVMIKLETLALVHWNKRLEGRT